MTIREWIAEELTAAHVPPERQFAILVLVAAPSLQPIAAIDAAWHLTGLPAETRAAICNRVQMRALEQFVRESAARGFPPVNAKEDPHGS